MSFLLGTAIATTDALFTQATSETMANEHEALLCGWGTQTSLEPVRFNDRVLRVVANPYLAIC